MSRQWEGIRDALLEFSYYSAICLVIAMALYFFGDRGLFAWGWPVLLGVLSLACGGSLLQSYIAGTRFYPRQLRVQFSLELALFHWNRWRRRGTGEEPILTFLEMARRAGGRTPLGDRLARTVDGVSSAAPVAWLTIGGELRTILEELSVKSQQRLPFPRYWVLPENCLAPISAVLAMMGVAAIPATPTVKLWTIGGVLQGVVLFALAFETLRWVRIITAKIHDVLSNQSFRIIMISSPADPTLMSARAAALYPRIGHFVHILVGEEEVGPSEPWHASGKYFFRTDLEGLPDILTAVAPQTDLIVLDSADEALAAQVRATTHPPVARYLALSLTGLVPQGYEWIEPMALRVPHPSSKPAYRPGADPYKIGVGPAASLWRFWFLQALVLSSVALFHIKEAAPLLLLIGVAAFAGCLPSQLLVLRRSSISRSTLRIPRAPKSSHKLVPRVLERRIYIGTALLFLGALWFIRSPLVSSWRHGEFSLAPEVFIVLTAWRRLVWGSLVAYKSWIDWNFRFLVLRRNARRYGYAHKAFLMATCGRYGQVISLRDDTLDQTDEGFGEWRESRLGFWFQVFSEIASALLPFDLLHTWQRQILMELEVTDFAVFDWIDEITDNMEWELRSAAERLPAHRMLIVHRLENHDEVERIIAACAESLSGRPHCLVAKRGPDDEYKWSNHRDFDQAFSEYLYRALSALVVEPRGTFRKEAIGSWPYPRQVL